MYVHIYLCISISIFIFGLVILGDTDINIEGNIEFVTCPELLLLLDQLNM